MSNRVPHTEGDATRALAGFALAVTLLLCAVLVAGELAAGMFRPWNDARLAPSAGLLHGYALYAAPGVAGPIWSWIYGPIAPLVYLPAALLPTPASSLAVALVATAAIYASAARLLLARSCTARGIVFEASFAALVLYSLAEPALRGAAFWIHADAPAIGLGALACAAISSQQRRRRSVPVALCALAAVLAVATKQVLLPLPFALAAYIGWADGPRAGARFLGWTTAAAALATLAFSFAFGWDALVFNLVTIPLAHPWQWGGGAGAVARGSGELALHALPLLSLLALDLGRDEDPKDRGPQPRVLLLTVALALAVAAVVTRAKVGAGLNAHAFALFFLAVAAAGAVADAAARSTRLGGLALVAAIAAGLALGVPSLVRLPELLRALPENPETTGLALASEAPGTLYFPSHPLVMLYAEGRASHVSYGVLDRDLAGHRVDDEHFRAFTAPQLERVALWTVRDDYALRRLPELTEREAHGTQPGWMLVGAGYSRP